MIQNGISAAFTFQSGGLPINFDLMCLQCEKISFLALRIAKVEFITMLNFSLRQRRQVLFIGLNVGIFFSSILHVTFGSLALVPLHNVIPIATLCLNKSPPRHLKDYSKLLNHL